MSSWDTECGIELEVYYLEFDASDTDLPNDSKKLKELLKILRNIVYLHSV